jgi:hypothetical protein
MNSGCLGEQNGNPSTAYMDSSTKDSPERLRPSRRVFDFAGGGAAVGEVQAENPPGINIIENHSHTHSVGGNCVSLVFAIDTPRCSKSKFLPQGAARYNVSRTPPTSRPTLTRQDRCLGCYNFLNNLCDNGLMRRCLDVQTDGGPYVTAQKVERRDV